MQKIKAELTKLKTPKFDQKYKKNKALTSFNLFLFPKKINSKPQSKTRLPAGQTFKTTLPNLIHKYMTCLPKGKTVRPKVGQKEKISYFTKKSEFFLIFLK